MVILDRGVITKKMERELISIQMDKDTKEIGSETKNMAAVPTGIKMEMFTQGSGKKITDMVREL